MPFIVVQPLHAFRTRVAIIETVAPWRGLGTFATDCDATELLTAEHADNAEKCRQTATILFNPVKTPPFAWPPRSTLRGIKAKRPLRGSGSV